MSSSLSILLLIVLFTSVSTYIVIRVIAKRKIRRELKKLFETRQEEMRLKLKAQFSKKAEKAQEANTQFSKLLNFNRGFLSNYELSTWRNSFNELFLELKDQPYNKVGIDVQNLSALHKFCTNFQDSETIRSDYNKSFISSELDSYKSFFDNFQGISLDEKQRRAILTDEDNCLLVAGAGSGKTTTVAAKVAYLLDRYRVDPSEILLISFTKKACQTLTKKVNEKTNLNVEACTFNKVGLDIIKQVEGLTQRSVCALSQKEINQIFSSFFKSLTQEESYRRKAVDFFSSYLKPYKPDEAFENEGERIQFMKDHKLYGFKLVRGQNRNGDEYEYRERLKSQEEVEIANFLLFNNINYEYEHRYEFNTANKEFGQYKPDFYLPDHNIYIEHFGVSKDGKVPSWFQGSGQLSAQDKYKRGIKWKRNIHETKGTVLIETYSWEKGEGKLLSNLKEKLQRINVHLKPKSADEVWNIISEAAKEDVSNFIQLLHNFVTLAKSGNFSFNEVRKNAETISDNEEKKRTHAFLDLLLPVFRKYENFLKERGEIDFNDMLNQAVNYVKNDKIEFKYKYLIIDEFQDISLGRYHLIKAVLDKTPSTKLFCVGDDWQSVFRFTGSDIGIFTEFDRFFRTSPLPSYTRSSERLFLETTYRFNQNLIQLSSDFILKNKTQLTKTLKSHRTDDKTVKTSIPYNNQSITIEQAVTKALEDILSRSRQRKLSTVKILCLGRYSHDFDHLANSQEFNRVFDSKKGKHFLRWKKASHFEIDFLTIHSAKGLEADYVLLINLNSGKYGFPSELTDDPVLNLVVSENDAFPNNEERRLFYVALTRTKYHVYLIFNERMKSRFLIELEGQQALFDTFCPECETGTLRKTKGVNGEFYSCSNFPFCRYSQNEKPVKSTRELNEIGKSFRNLSSNFRLNLRESSLIKFLRDERKHR